MNDNNMLAIIAAAGIGERFGNEIPKQYLKINGNTVIERAVKPFLESKDISEIIISVSQDDNLIQDQNFYNCKKIKYVFGGTTRQESIRKVK